MIWSLLMKVYSKSFTQVGIFMPFLANSFFKVRSAGLFAWIFKFISFHANTRIKRNSSKQRRTIWKKQLNQAIERK